MFGLGKKNEPKQQVRSNRTDNKKEAPEGPVPETISKCEACVKEIFGSSADIVVQTFETKKADAMIVYVDGLVNKDLLDRDVVAPLKAKEFDGNVCFALKVYAKKIDDMTTFISEVLQGNIALFYGSSKKIFIIDLKQWDRRPVETPDSESVIRGPREGFTESIRTNSALLRRKIRTPQLIIENMTIGRQSNTPIGLAYMKGIVNQEVLKEVKARLSQIDTDIILETGNIEQYIDEYTFSTLSGIGVTQKPDVVAGKILEGRVAVLCDGTPHVLTIPELFIEHIQTSEDYYIRVLMATTLRILRILGLFITIMLPGLAVAIITFSQEMMPTVFLTNLIASTQKTPLPAGAEFFFLILMFELLKEAGTRLPKTIGSAITIVGALIIGDAAVNAGIVGAPAVIIVALTAVTSFITPNLTAFVLIYRFLFLFLGSSMGLIGIGTGIMIMLIQLASTISFGIPILSSFSKHEMKDSVIRFPLKDMKYRPPSIAKDNVQRRP